MEGAEKGSDLDLLLEKRRWNLYLISERACFENKFEDEYFSVATFTLALFL